MSARQSRRYPYNYNTVFMAAHQALLDCGFSVTGTAAGGIIASAGMSLMSWGEHLNVNVTATAGGVVVDMESSPVFLTDWGRSSDNVQSFFMALDRRLFAGAPAYGAPSYGVPEYSQPAYGQPTYGYQPAPGLYMPPQAEPSTTTPVVLAVINGVVALLLGVTYMAILVEVGICIFIVALILFMGAGLISARNYKAGAVLCFIGGIVTIPLGILGIIAGSKAWEYSKWEERRAMSSNVITEQYR